MKIKKSINVILHVLLEVKELFDLIKIIDVAASADGEVLNVLMNADMEMAVGILAEHDH